MSEKFSIVTTDRFVLTDNKDYNYEGKTVITSFENEEELIKYVLYNGGYHFIKKVIDIIAPEISQRVLEDNQKANEEADAKDDNDYMRFLNISPNSYLDDPDDIDTMYDIHDEQ